MMIPESTSLSQGLALRLFLEDSFKTKLTQQYQKGYLCLAEIRLSFGGVPRSIASTANILSQTHLPPSIID
eukprot:scaffold2268_cov43-Prasinocladus_malaysianus.AAC.1